MLIFASQVGGGLKFACLAFNSDCGKGHALESGSMELMTKGLFQLGIITTWDLALSDQLKF